MEQMSLEERLQAMELLWASLARTPDAVPTPDWHKEVVAERREKIQCGEAEFITIDPLEERLKKSSP